MNKRGFAVIGLFILLVGIVLGYIAASGSSTVGMASKLPYEVERCTDSDGGYDPYTLGYVEYKDKVYTDRCFGDKLYEVGCVKDRVYTRRYECQNGCSVGACIR